MYRKEHRERQQLSEHLCLFLYKEDNRYFSKTNTKVSTFPYFYVCFMYNRYRNLAEKNMFKQRSSTNIIFRVKIFISKANFMKYLQSLCLIGFIYYFRGQKDYGNEKILVSAINFVFNKLRNINISIFRNISVMFLYHFVARRLIIK